LREIESAAAVAQLAAANAADVLVAEARISGGWEGVTECCDGNLEGPFSVSVLQTSLVLWGGYGQ